MSSARRNRRITQTGRYRVEGLEQRLFLSAAIAAFQDQQVYPIGANPLAVAAVDVNRDGKPDLIVANSTSNTIGVLLGIGDGRFQNQQTYATGINPISVVATDVNGDGKPDLLVANYNSNTVGVLLGNGDGTFQAQQTFGTGTKPISIGMADVNRDGKPDLFVANFSDNTVGVLLGNGDGTFRPQQTFVAGSGPFSIAISDANGDDIPDVVVANYNSGTVGVLLRNGIGTFQPQQTFATGTHPQSVVVADVNGDSKPDLIVTNEGANTASVLLGNGSFQGQQTFAAGTHPHSVAVADLNGDGKPDLTVANGGDNTVAVLLGNGDGAFQPQKTFVASANPSSITVSDVNGDGRQDLVVANQGSNNVSVLLGDVPPMVLSINRTNPPGPFASGSNATYTVTFNEPVTGVDPSDFTLTLSGVTATTPVVVSGSGAVYTVTINGISGSGTLGLNLLDDGSIEDAAGNPLQPGGTASFRSQQSFPAGESPSSVAVTDLNKDGKPDIVVSNSSNDGYMTVWLGNGNGSFQRPNLFPTFRATIHIAVADFNRDGNLDVVSADFNSNTAIVLLGIGNGKLQYPRSYATADHPYAVAVADVNGDGVPDLLLTAYGNYFNTQPGTVSVLLGFGDVNGMFLAQRTFGTGISPRDIAVADLNGDGRPDLLVANYVSNTVSILLGNGNGTFQIQQTYAIAHPLSIATADVNRDGNSDLLVATNGSDSISVLLGNGNGTFQDPQTFAVGSEPVSVLVSDVNGDGKPDVVVANRFPGSGGDSLSVLLGNGNGTFQVQQTFAAGAAPTSVAVSDLNGDGRADLAVANGNDGTASVLLGNSNGNFTGQVYTVVPLLDTITGTAGIDQITLIQDPDHTHIDWTLGATTAQLLINDPNGLTINGIDSNDVITLVYTNGNPLPDLLNLNGTFTINGLSDATPLANTTLEIARSTVFISYSASDPLALIQGYLKNGYNNGGWNGTPTVSTGVITSTPARTNPNHNTAVGYVDSADGTGINSTVNSIELKYTLYGDTNLDGSVAFLDFSSLAANYNVNGAFAWDQGSFDYSGSVNFNSFSLLAANYNTTLGSQATPAAATTPTSSIVTAPTPDATKVKLAIQVGPPHQSALQHRHTAKRPKKHR